MRKNKHFSFCIEKGFLVEDQIFQPITLVFKLVCFAHLHTTRALSVRYNT